MITGLDVALSQLGVHESTGRNDGIPAERYMRGDIGAWCAGLVLWCNEVSDDEPMAASTAEHYAMRSVSTMIEVFKRKGWWIPRSPDFVPQPNDLGMLGKDGISDVGVQGHHVFRVEAIDGDGEHFTSIDGNWGNKVARERRRLDDKTIVGWGRVT